MFYSSQKNINQEQYQQFLRIVGSLSNLSSDSNVPYLEKWVGLDEPTVPDRAPIEGDERPQIAGTHDRELGVEPTEPPRRRRR